MARNTNAPTRKQLAQVSSGNQKTIRQLEQLWKSNVIPQEFVFVSTHVDFPPAISGVITLADNTIYFIVAEIDLGGNRILGGENNALIGGAVEVSIIKSTGLVGVPLITDTSSLEMRFLSLSADIVFDLTGTINDNLDWVDVRFVDCNSMGTIRGYGRCDFILLQGENCYGMLFDGSFKSISFDNCRFYNNDAGGAPVISLLATSSVSERIKVVDSSFSITSPAIGINADIAASIGVEQYILTNNNFTGTGVFVSGVQFNDNKASFFHNFGIPESSSIANYYMTNNATATVISAVDTPVKILGTTAANSIFQRFSHSDNRATYTGSVPRNIKVNAVATMISNNNNQLGLYISKNGVVLPQSVSVVTASSGGRANSTVSQTIDNVVNGDYFEAWVENRTGSANITVEDLNLIIETV